MCFHEHILEVYTDFYSSSVFIALFGLKCHLWQKYYKTITRNLMLKWGNVFEKILHLRFWSFFSEDTTREILKHLLSQGSQQKCSTDYSGSSHHRSSSTSLRWKWAWRSKVQKRRKKRLSQRKTEVSGRLKKSHTEHHLVSKTVVQNTTKIMFSLPEKTSYLAIVTDAWCNDW